MEEAKSQKAPRRYINGLPAEAPKHRVRITRPYYAGIFEMTQAAYERVAKHKRCEQDSDYEGAWKETLRRYLRDFLRLRELLDSEPLPMIQQSIDAFRRELPELLRTHPGRWVAYHSDQRVGFGKTQTERYQRCFAQGLTRDDFIVEFTEPGAFEPDEGIEATC